MDSPPLTPIDTMTIQRRLNIGLVAVAVLVVLAVRAGCAGAGGIGAPAGSCYLNGEAFDRITDTNLWTLQPDVTMHPGPDLPVHRAPRGLGDYHPCVVRKSDWPDAQHLALATYGSSPRASGYTPRQQTVDLVEHDSAHWKLRSTSVVDVAAWR